MLGAKVLAAMLGQPNSLARGVPSGTGCSATCVEAISRATTHSREIILNAVLLTGAAGVTTAVIYHCWKLALRIPSVNSGRFHKAANILVNAFSPTTLSERIIVKDLLDEFNKFTVEGSLPTAELANGLEGSIWDTSAILHAVGGPLSSAERKRVWKATKGDDAIKRKRYIFKITIQCKNKFGVPRRTFSNRTAVFDFAVKLMENDGHPPTAIMRDVPTVLLLVFIPTNQDLELIHLGNSCEFNR